MTSFFCKQLDAPSIGTAVDGLPLSQFCSQNVVRFSVHMQPLTSISALTLGPTLGAKICHIHYSTETIGSSSIQRLSRCNLGVGINSKQRQRQDTNGFSCKLYLLTLGLINTLYYNSQHHNCGDKTVEKNPRILKIHHMTLHSSILCFYNFSQLIYYINLYIKISLNIKIFYQVSLLVVC